MARRSGQVGYEEVKGGWYHARFRMDVPGQEKRAYLSRPICPVSGPGAATTLLRQIPCIGPIRAAQLIALMQTPHRFRTKSQLWTYSGLGLAAKLSMIARSQRIMKFTWAAGMLRLSSGAERGRCF
jgi:hypothetical protein